MPNTIEKPIVPYNATPTKVVQREEYSLFAPIAANGRIGMAGFDPKHFDIKEQIVSLANSYINTLFRVVDVRGAIPEDVSWNKHGKKTPNIAYKNSSYEVVTTVALNGTMKKSEKVGTLIVLVNESATDVFTEIFCADGQFYIRTYNDGEELTNLSFLPLIDTKRLTNIADGARADAEEALSKSDTALSAITNAALTYSPDTGTLAFAYYLNGEWVNTTELDLPIESSIVKMVETANAEGVPILQLTLASGVVTEVALDDIFHGFVTKTLLKATIKNLATEEYVNNAVENLATEEYVNNTTEEYVNNAVENLATEEYVNNAVENLATEEYVNNAIENLATEEYVDNAVANAGGGGGGAKLYCHRISISSDFGEEWMDNPQFGFTGVAYKSTATPIQSFEDITNEDLMSFRPNTFWLWDSPEENKFAYEFGKNVRTGVFMIGYIDGWEDWGGRHTPTWGQIEVYPSNITVYDIVTEV